MLDPERLAHSVFTKHEGKEFMKHLTERFQEKKLYSETSTKLAYNVGQYDVVQYIKSLIEGNDI